MKKRRQVQLWGVIDVYTPQANMELHSRKTTVFRKADMLFQFCAADGRIKGFFKRGKVAASSGATREIARPTPSSSMSSSQKE